jgi:hypothetical protein
VDPTETDHITLTVPAASAAVRIARAGAAALATRAGFTYREIEELQLAVGEATALLAPEPDGDGSLTIVFDVQADSVRVDLELAGAPVRTGSLVAARADGGAAATTPPSIAAAVLDAAVDSWGVLDDGRRIVLAKRSTDSDDE